MARPSLTAHRARGTGWRGCAWTLLRAYGLLVVLPLTLYLLIGYGYASWRTRSADRGWARSFESTDALRARLPRTTPSADAERLDALAHPLGVSLIGAMEKSPQLEAVAAFLARLEKAGDDTLQVPPPDVQRFLRTHAAVIDAVEDHALQGASIEWAQDIDAGYHAPTPSLVAHRALHAILLGQAHEHARTSRRAEMNRALEASWRLSISARKHESAIGQLVSIVLTRMQNAVLRHHSALPPEWTERTTAYSFRGGMLRSFQVEAHLFGHIARGFKGLTDLEEPADGRRLGGPAAWVVRVLTAPWLRLSAASFSDRLRAISEDLRTADPCDPEVDVAADAAREPLPRWNIIGRVALPGLPTAWTSGAAADLDGERTRLVLEAHGRWAATGRWGPLRTSASGVCRGLSWVERTMPDGSLTIGPDRDLPPRLGQQPWSFTLRRRPLPR